MKIDEMDGEVVLRLDKSDYSTYSSMDKMLRAWLTEAKKLRLAKAPKRNMMTGVTNILNWIHTKSGLRFLHKNFLIC